MQKIRNIIFDLGGVFLDLDTSKTHEAFKKIGIRHIEEMFRLGHADPIFSDHEQGIITDEEFIVSLKALAGNSVSTKELIGGWNALLVGFPPERIRWLERLKTKYRLFLFSNTNGIHLEAIYKMYTGTFGGSFDDLFEKAYYSHLVKIRKPDTAAYELVVTENKLEKAETVFIDDTLANVEAAQVAGLQAIHLRPGLTLLDLEL